MIFDWQGTADALTVVARLAEERLAGGIIVLVPPESDAELALREVGATNVFPATVAPAQLARQCQQWLDSTRHNQPRR